MTIFNRPLDHINLTVPNLEKAIDFYTNTMGFTVTHRFNIGQEFVFITDGNIVYELMENPALQSTVIDHIAYVSSDIKADFAHFDALGITTSGIGQANLFEHGVYYFFIKGAGNDRIEFLQRKGATS